MCGLAGWYCFQDTIPSLQVATDLLLSIADRGPDATGVATTTPKNTIQVLKGPFVAKDFVEKEKFKSMVLGRTVLLHTRHKTQGSEFNNVNNHPVVSGSWVVTHNGTVKNANNIFKELALTRNGEVDSEAIPALLNVTKNADEIPTFVRLFEGMNTFVGIDRNAPGQLVMAKLGKDKPLWLAVAEGVLYWSSNPTVYDIVPAPHFLIWKRVLFEEHPDNFVTLITPTHIKRIGAEPLSYYEFNRVNWSVLTETRRLELGVTAFSAAFDPLPPGPKVATLMVLGKKNGAGRCTGCQKTSDRAKWFGTFVWPWGVASGLRCPSCSASVEVPNEWKDMLTKSS